MVHEHEEAQQHKQRELDQPRCWGHRQFKIKRLSAEGKQTLDSSASASPGGSFQAKISAKSNKYMNHWEHPSSAQARGRLSIPGGWCPSAREAPACPMGAARGHGCPRSRVRTAFVPLPFKCMCAAF